MGRVGVFCHNGLGDGVNCLVLSQNLYRNGWEVETYHNGIGSMQNWFPHLPVTPYPSLQHLEEILLRYDLFLVVHNDTDLFVQSLMREGKRRFPEKMKVIYLYPSPNIVNEPYYQDCLTDPTLSIAENLRRVCSRVLHLPLIDTTNGFTAPPGLVYRRFAQRVVIHPTSARETRNWPQEKFVKLALHLQHAGFETVFVPGKEKSSSFRSLPDIALEEFDNLDQLARYLYESGFLIGNDSGLGHLASALQIPTLTICRRKAWARMWAPSFACGEVVVPSSLIPNIRGLRLRDQYWKYFISVDKVLSGFEKLLFKKPIHNSTKSFYREY